jgi:hypothetical protein
MALAEHCDHSAGKLKEGGVVKWYSTVGTSALTDNDDYRFGDPDRRRGRARPHAASRRG